MLTAVEVSKGNLQEDKPACNFTTKVSYSTILTSLESVHDGNFDSLCVPYFLGDRALLRYAEHFPLPGV